jgi:ubiquinol-cytochrome c reductase cytochrome b/c1 subunit
LFIFFGAVIGLGYLGAREPTGGYVIAARILTIYYFAFFFMILPLLGLFEKTKSVPNSIFRIGAAAWRFGWCAALDCRR